jgi:putative restriction endonuclease
LAEPFFLDRSEWIPVPMDWPKSIQTGKTYHTDAQPGRDLWEAVRSAIVRQPSVGAGAEMPVPRDGEPLGPLYLTRGRIGQGAFRVLVTDAYGRRCAATGERTLPVLEAAHIKPYAESGPNHVNNGLLLRCDLHILFDRGYLTVNKGYRLEVSPRIREEFENGRQYYAMAGHQLVVLPERDADRPADGFIEWHNENVYLG